MRMIEQPSHERPGFTRVAGFEKRGRLYAAIEDAGFVGTAECDLPDVLQGNTGIRRKTNGGLLRIGPTLSEVIAGSQQGSPIALSGGPYAVLTAARVKGHGGNIVTVKVGATHIPAGAWRIRVKYERSLPGSRPQNK